MRPTFRVFAAASLLFAGCASHGLPDSVVDDALVVPAGARIELAVDGAGRVLATEFHCRPEVVPQAALRAVEAAVPGGEIVDCEKEYDAGGLFYEVSKRVDGRVLEVMVTPDGRIVRREIEVPTAQVPDAVLEAAAAAVPGGSRTKVEEIRDAGNQLVEYHVKAEHAGIRYKARLAPAGELLELLREVDAEVEVPVRR